MEPTCGCECHLGCNACGGEECSVYLAKAAEVAELCKVPAAPPLVWSTVTPTEAGHYWHRHGSWDDEPEVLCVYRCGMKGDMLAVSGLAVFQIGNEHGSAVLQDFIAQGADEGPMEWAGPLPFGKPAEPVQP